MPRLLLAAAATLATTLALPALAQEAPEAPPQVVAETAGYDHQARPLMLVLAGAVLFLLMTSGDDDKDAAPAG